MPILAVVMVVAAALLHASWNVAVKRAGSDRHFMLLVSVLIVVLWAPVGAWALAQATGPWGWRESLAVAASGAVHLAYFQTLLRGYRESDLTVVYPVARGTGPLLSSAGAVVLLGETLSAVGALGVLGITAGVLLVAGGASLWRPARDAAQAARIRAGLRWGAATGCLISLYTLIDGYAVKVLMISPLLVDYAGNLCRLPMLAAGSWGDGTGIAASWRRYRGTVFVVAALSPMSYTLVLYAMRIAPLSHVAPARELSMLFAALVGGKLLGEGDRALRIAGAACIAAGVAALSW